MRNFGRPFLGGQCFNPDFYTVFFNPDVLIRILFMRHLTRNFLTRKTQPEFFNPVYIEMTSFKIVAKNVC